MKETCNLTELNVASVHKINSLTKVNGIIYFLIRAWPSLKVHKAVVMATKDHFSVKITMSPWIKLYCIIFEKLTAIQTIFLIILFNA